MRNLGGGLIRQVESRGGEESRGAYKASGRITHSEESRGLIRQVVV